MQVHNFNITGYSTALFSTWFFVEELGLLFDVGDGVTSTLLQKSRKIKQVFVSHADRDHLTGLFQFHQLNARDGFPIIHFPADSGSFPAIEQFVNRFDPHVSGAIWKPILPKTVHKIKDKIYVQAIRNNHVSVAEDITKSLSYLVLQRTPKLKAEFQHLSNEAIKNISISKGRDFITEIVTEKILAYSGDTPIDNYEHWEDTKVLIHEATFLDNDINLNTKKNKHSTLEEVIKMVSNLNIEKLILSHFSSRYAAAEIDAAIRKYCKLYKIEIPVFRILPGEVSWNILSGRPINE